MNIFEKDAHIRRSSFASTIDQGLRSYMLRVYNYMLIALALTGLVAYTVSESELLFSALFGSSFAWVVMFSPLIMVFFLTSRLHTMSVSAAQTSFWIYSILVGLSFAPLFYTYTGQSIARVFFICSGMFGAMSLYGYTTEKDLTSFGSFLFMGVVGIILAGIVNIFMGSSTLSLAISVIGVFVFTGLTAYDTQSIKDAYQEDDHAMQAEKKAIFGALRLYLDFINLFVMLLRLLGEKR